jgi:hypothetical protein
LPSSTLKHTYSATEQHIEALPTGYKLISITARLKISSKYLEVIRKWRTTEELKWYISMTASLKISSKYLEIIRKWSTTEEMKW